MRSDWIRDGKIRFLAQMGMKPHPDLKDVPFVLDLVKSPDDRSVLELIFAKYQFGRPYFVPPEVPAERVDALRAAFGATMNDPELLADAQKQRLEVNPVSGADVQAMIEKLYRTPSRSCAARGKFSGPNKKARQAWRFSGPALASRCTAIQFSRCKCRSAYEHWNRAEWRLLALSGRAGGNGECPLSG